MRLFTEELLGWMGEAHFDRVSILTSTHNPVRKLRASNMHLPVIYYHSSKEDDTQWAGLGLTKWAHWLDASQRTHEHVELEDLDSAGWGADLMEKLVEKDVKVTLFAQFSHGGYDALGGYFFYKFLVSQSTGAEETLLKQIDSLSLEETQQQVHTGVEMLQNLFSGSETKIPDYWKHLQF
jgi:hypothetical protein